MKRNPATIRRMLSRYGVHERGSGKVIPVMHCKIRAAYCCASGVSSSYIVRHGALMAGPGLCSLLHIVTATVTRSDATQWQPAAGPLMTRWATEVTPDRALPEYPRPQLVRQDWQNLNGLWEYAVRPRAEGAPASFDGRIL